MISHDTNDRNRATIPEIDHVPGNTLDDALKAHSLGLVVLPGDQMKPFLDKPLADEGRIREYWGRKSEDEVWIITTPSHIFLEIERETSAPIFKQINDSTLIIRSGENKLVIYKNNGWRVNKKQEDIYPGIHLNRQFAYRFRSDNIITDKDLATLTEDLIRQLEYDNFDTEAYHFPSSRMNETRLLHNPLLKYCGINNKKQRDV